MDVAVGSDEAGLDLKKALMEYLLARGIKVTDYGCYSPDPVDYPDVALKVSEAIVSGRHDRGILVCGTGIGMAIAANKVPGIRAAQCHDVYSAERARKSNNAQIITLGARVIGVELAKVILDAWLRSEFEGGRSTRKVAKIDESDKWFRSADRLSNQRCADDGVKVCTQLEGPCDGWH